MFDTVFDWETKPSFLKWSLTGGGRLRKVVAMREFTVVIFDQHQGKHDLNKKSNWTEWRAPFLFKMRSHAGYKLQQKTDTYHIIHADCFVCIFGPPTRIRRFLKRHKFFYTNLPSVHTKPVSPLTQTASFWNRSLDLSFCFDPTDMRSREDDWTWILSILRFSEAAFDPSIGNVGQILGMTFSLLVII